MTKEIRSFKIFVKNELTKHDKTSRELASEIGVSDAVLSNWLNGLVKLETFKDIVMGGLNKLKSN